jgi:hypothetical protein
MPLQLVDRVWMLAERLYIHAHSTDEFVAFLKSNGIEYGGAPYDAFGTTKGRYTFMSEPDFTFAEFMTRVPTHKYLPLLEHIVFDEKTPLSSEDNWNYYGERIKNWYPELLELLTLAGVAVDSNAKTLAHTEIEEQAENGDYLGVVFADPFIDHIREETNAAYTAQHYLSVSFLSRKIVEVVITRLCEVVFPKIDAAGSYSESNHDLWCDSNSRTVCFLAEFGAQSGVRRVSLGRWGWCDWL